MSVIDKITHSELGLVSLRRVESRFDGVISVGGHRLDQGELVVVFDHYLERGDFPFIVPEEFSLVRQWAEVAEEWDGTFTCFVCGEKATKIGVYSGEGKAVMAHDDCVDWVSECVGLLVDRNPAMVSADVI